MGDISSTAQIRLAMIEFYYQIKDASVAASSFKLSRKAFYKWVRRYERSGKQLSSLENLPKTPKTKRTVDLSFKTELDIKHLREKHIRLGKVKLQILFKREYGYFVSQSHISYVIQKYSLYFDPVSASRIRSRKIKDRRAKKVRINDINPKTLLTDGKPFLFALDTIVLYLPYGIKRYILTAIEYEKKIAYARCYKSKSSLSAFDFLLRLQALVEGTIAAVLSDNGSEFALYFEEACRKLKIAHIFTRVKTPKDNAVDERFNRTLEEEFMQVDEYFESYLAYDSLIAANQRLTEWLMFYNFERPHQTLKYKTPIEWYNSYKLKRVLPMYPTLTSS